MLLVAEEDVEVYVVKCAVTAVTVAPASEERSYVAQPRLPEELMVTMFPSFLTPAELTDPDLYEPAVPVQVKVVVVCPHELKTQRQRMTNVNSFLIRFKFVFGLKFTKIHGEDI